MAARRSVRRGSVPEAVRVMAVADNRFGALLLQGVLSRFSGCEVVSSVATCDQAVAAAASTPVDVALINQNLDGEHLKGLHLAKLLSSSVPTIRPVIMVSSANREVVAESFQSGARGVFHDGEPLEALWDCISQVHQGRLYASQSDIAYLVEALIECPPLRLLTAKGKAILTNKEQVVVQYVTEGYTNREIAVKLGLSEHTVKNYLFRIFDRLGVSSRAEMIFYVLSRRPQATEQEKTPAERARSVNGSSVSSCLEEAHQGCANAQYRLATLYEAGEEVPRDAISAYMWSAVAEKTAAGLMESARAAKNTLATKMTSSEIAAAHARVVNWLSKNGHETADPSRTEDSRLETDPVLDMQLPVSQPEKEMLPLLLAATTEKALPISSRLRADSLTRPAR